jgi:hypothetical protein
MNEIPIACLQLRFAGSANGSSRPHLLRGALANLFPDEPILHQHGQNGLIYRYPLVHYRWRNGDGLLVGFHEGAHLLARLPLIDRPLQLGTVTTNISDVEIHFATQGVRVAERLVRYCFASPWVPFNQENYQIYRGLNQNQQADERDRIAVANLLIALRGLKIEFPGRLYAAVQVSRAIPCTYKDQTFIGFWGTLITNVDFPDDIAIGRAVSHGYGWLKRVSGHSETNQS